MTTSGKLLGPYNSPYITTVDPVGGVEILPCGDTGSDEANVDRPAVGLLIIDVSLVH